MPIELDQVAEQFRDAFSEMYEVVRTIEVVMGTGNYRVEIVKGVDHAGVFYDARYLAENSVSLNITTPVGFEMQTAGVGKGGAYAWVRHTYVRDHRPDPDAALIQALGVLSGKA